MDYLEYFKMCVHKMATKICAYVGFIYVYTYIFKSYLWHIHSWAGILGP